MGPFGSVLSVAVLILLANQVNSAKEYIYFSDYDQCDKTYVVGRDDVVEIAPNRPSSGASSAFTDCKLLFRAVAIEDKICIKIQTLTFTNDKLELQYFDSLDPESTVQPAEKYNRASSYSTPIEICSDVYEFTLKLHSAVADANINDIDALITVFNMQGTHRIAYFDEDCATTFKLRDSTVAVQTINAAGSKPIKPVCHLYFEYIGTNPNKTVCYQYQSLRADVCDYTMKVMDGDQTSFTLVHTYTCATTTPQSYCTTEKTLTLELLNNGSTGLPDNTFTITVKDGTKDTTRTEPEEGFSTNFPMPTEPEEGFPAWAIAVILIGSVAVVAVVGIVIYKATTGVRAYKMTSEGQRLEVSSLINNACKDGEDAKSTDQKPADPESTVLDQFPVEEMFKSVISAENCVINVTIMKKD